MPHRLDKGAGLPRLRIGAFAALQERGHIERSPDPADRRVRLLAITDSGRAIKDAVQSDIQRGEERWLGQLSGGDREVFLRVLEQLSR